MQTNERKRPMGLAALDIGTAAQANGNRQAARDLGTFQNQLSTSMSYNACSYLP